MDRLPSEIPHGESDSFSRVELIDGALVFAAPQSRLHERTVYGLSRVVEAQVPDDLTTVTRMDVKLGHRTRLCPDMLMIDAAAADDMDRTFYTPDEVHLVVEVVSPESEERDRRLKPARYAEAGIAHFWRVEDNGGRPVVYVYELDPATRTYAVTGIHHGKLSVPVPFPIDIDLDDLPR
ncbi:Uma2 family endonuclease [Actinoallomurus rhizosphaericola]|uniref:Uma2 family endonuclease n=1 Tax=Actinoallomurus rhizosphaericola TaxID=2952536 RepID=UPI002091B1DA|nr:Uma2 family endonuclease [Actinoallomurus rhizosphaericola]MCO5993314.1 Uma2 family endonuclease [Actinoallomurus rhizosphaericola]